MSKIIKKYKLESQFSNESEFEVTRIKQVETITTTRTDNEGYPISDRQEPKRETKTKHGLSAISLPSRKPAKIIPLEVEEVNESQALMFEASLGVTEHRDSPVQQPVNERPRPIKSSHLLENTYGPNGRPAAIDLTRVLEGNKNLNTSNLKNEGIVWADSSDSIGDAGIEPF